MIHKLQNVLVIAPHTDDGELGCGGTIARLIESGSSVTYVAFSTARESVPGHLPEDILEKEVKEAVRTLGIDNNHLIILNFRVRHFPQFRQEILEELIRLRKELSPDQVLLPALYDIHQDHEVIAREGIRAFKHSGIWGYELPWNNLSSSPGVFVSLSEDHINTKLKAIRCYKSQSGRSYFDEEFIRSQARNRGLQCGTDHAEAFQIIRQIWKI